VQHLAAVSYQKFDRFPHDQVVPAKSLENLIRGAKLLYSSFAMLEKNGRGKKSRAASSEDDKALTGFDDFFIYIKKEGERLWGKAVPSPRSNMEAIEFQNRGARSGYFDIHSASLRLANSATGRTPESGQ
jgi:hypothetical protein